MICLVVRALLSQVKHSFIRRVLYGMIQRGHPIFYIPVDSFTPNSVCLSGEQGLLREEGGVMVRVDSRVYRGLSVLLCLVLSGCYHRASLIKRRIAITYKSPTRHSISKHLFSAEKPVITVLIHGTKFMRSDTYKKVFNGIPDVKHIREFPSAHKVQFPMQLLHRDAPGLFDYNSLYLFGWSGRLSTHERYWAATILYEKLTALAESYQQKFGVFPEIRLVTHSHGGNVALNLARIHKMRKAPLSITTLVLLACPVQHETKELVHSHFFEKIYAFYSSLDMVQVLAPEFMYKMRDDEGSVIGSCLRLIPFSNRCFAANMPVRQAWIKINGHGITHGGFTTSKFLRTLPALLREVDEIYAEYEDMLCAGQKEILLHVQSRCANRYQGSYGR